jgi:hypothetical protein
MPETKKLNTREEVSEVLPTPWNLDNCDWDEDPALPRYQASHPKLGVLARQSGSELVAAVREVEEAAEELRELGRELRRGNMVSPYASWWDGPVLAETSAHAAFLQDLMVVVRLRERAEDAAPTRKPRAKGRAAAPAPAALLTASTVDLPAFAARVMEVARSLTGDARFGASGKVFINRVWRVLQGEWVSREEFNTALVQAIRTGVPGFLMSRADLVSAMNPVDVAESEVRNLGARYHFVDTGWGGE